jgi:hypothetical protein
MDREAVLQWLKEHPASVHEDPARLVERFEAEVRRHAEEDAWLAAKAYVEDRMHDWEQRWGYHSSEAYAAKQICPELAEELRRMEPHFQEGDEAHLVGAERLEQLEPEARRVVEDWVRDVANEVEHKIWQEVVRYTKERGRGLVREGRVSEESRFDETRAFAQQAARVARILVDELEVRAHPGA